MVLQFVGQSIVDCRSVRHIAQGVLAHILGRLPCPKKTPRKIWRFSVSANLIYQMENNTGKRLQNHQLPNKETQLPAQTKDRKSRNSRRYIAESPTALQTVEEKYFSMNHRTSRKRQQIIRFGYTASRGIAPNDNGLTLSVR